MGTVMASRRTLYLALLGLLAAVVVAGCTASPASSPAAPGHGRPASPSALTAVSPGAASGSASAGPGGVRALAVSPDVRNELTAAFADYKGISPSDIAGISPGSVYYAYDPATDTYWALANFLPSLTAPFKVLVGFQDGASIGLFTRIANGSWQVQFGVFPPSAPRWPSSARSAYRLVATGRHGWVRLQCTTGPAGVRRVVLVPVSEPGPRETSASGSPWCPPGRSSCALADPAAGRNFRRGAERA